MLTGSEGIITGAGVGELPPSGGPGILGGELAYYLLQKRPDGQSEWDDVEGSNYSFAQRLPNAKSLCKNDVVLFYRPVKSGTPEDGCIYATAVVAAVVIGGRGFVDAELRDFEVLAAPVPLNKVGDPRANAQHSFQPVPRAFYEAVVVGQGEKPEAQP